MMPYLDCVKVWQRPSEDAETSKYTWFNIFTEESGPKLLLECCYQRDVLILKAVISPNGKRIAVLTTSGLYVHSISVQEGGKPKVSTDYSIPTTEIDSISAIYSTNSNLYFAHENCILERFNYDAANREILAMRRVLSVL